MFYQKSFYEAKLGAHISHHQAEYEEFKRQFRDPAYKTAEIWTSISPKIASEFRSTLRDFYRQASSLAEFFRLIAEHYGERKYEILSNNYWYMEIFNRMWIWGFDNWYHDIYERPEIDYSLADGEGVFDLIEILKGIQGFRAVVVTDFGEFNIRIDMSMDLRELVIRIGGERDCFTIGIEHSKIASSLLNTLRGHCEISGKVIRGENTIKLVDLCLTIAKDLYNYPYYNASRLIRRIKRKIDGLEERLLELEQISVTGGRRRRKTLRRAYRRSRNTSAI
jgi:hypothetical protein